MQTLKYALIIDTYNFTYSVGEDFNGTFLISSPVVKTHDLVQFLKALETNTTGTLEIKTDTQLSFFLTTGNGFCTLQERFSIFIQSMRIRVSHDICVDVMKKFVNELLISSKNSEEYSKWKQSEQIEMSAMEILKKENQILKIQIQQLSHKSAKYKSHSYIKTLK